MFVQANNGSTRSLSNVLSALRCYARAAGLPWLSEQDVYRLQRLQAQLEFADLTPSRTKRAATLGVIMQVLSGLDYSLLSNRWFSLCCLLAHNGLLRSDELFSGIRVEDVEWDFGRKSFILHLPRTKTHRKGDPVQVRFQDYEGVSAYKLLLRWFEEHDLWHQPSAFLIPDLCMRSGRPARANFNLHGKRAGWNSMIQRLFTGAGFPARAYSGHSFRAGGATDLFALGVPYPVVKKAGRWKSDAALRYYRDDYGVAETVAAAFASGFRSMPASFQEFGLV